MPIKSIMSIFFIFALNSFAVNIHVQDISGFPISDATVCLGVQTTLFAKTDISGNAEIIQPQNDYYLFIARHQDFGRTNAQYINTASQSNITFTLPPQTSFRVATYNMKGFDQWDTSQIEPLAKIFWTVQPDVVCLQECPENGLTFTNFQNIYLPCYTSIVSHIGWSIHNGFLSFFPIETSYSYGWDVMTRDLYSATINVPGDPSITFLCAHFKCCDGDSEGEKRNQEAQFVAEHCSNLYANGEMFLFAGDLNDDPDYPRPPSQVHTILLVSNPAAHLVQIQATDDTGNSDTHIYYRRYDYLYPVDSLASNFISSKVFRTDTMNNRPAWLASDESEKASDHRMVYADFAIIPEPFLFLFYFAIIFIRPICPIHPIDTNNEKG